MANPYLSLPNYYLLSDMRTVKDLSNDQSSAVGNSAATQYIIDVCASQVDTVLAGRITLPIPTPPGPPLFLAGLVAALADRMMFGRRADLPKGIAAKAAAADQWLQDFKNGGVSLPGVPFASVPQLQNSDSVNGQSRFDYDFFTAPSPTSPAGSPGGVGPFNP